ncbi:T9SS type A sorting domain-containing protein [Emticicia agri]|uniref:T9SS type A sorting domain-containing protein n=1 Tax=Emticicia agri TaxID=2492393 RepID=A0A4Q5LVI6_9BACT|nr:T9SS type A sorting domain-containing protein [Emticicia agri]RYU93473.1 T9SS type A sorting domain-containing protein [Emticicia agri]
MIFKKNSDTKTPPNPPQQWGGLKGLSPHRWEANSNTVGFSTWGILALFLFFSPYYIKAQSCNSSTFQLNPTTQNRAIDWQKFPEFSLPFSVVYGGPRFGDTQRLPLKHGFSHLATFEGADDNLPKNQRAIVWYGVGYTGTNQPWESIKSPWNNNLDGYRAKWQHELATMPEVDLLVPDIERQIKSNDSILILKNHPTTPVAYRSLANNSFITQYKKDLQNLYAEAFGFTKGNKSAQIGGYSDAPILNTYINIPGNSWQKWTTDASLLNFLLYDFTSNKIGGEVYSRQDFFSPAAYYYYDYPNPLAADYLAYLLFQIEVNKAWAPTKPIIPFVWLRYSYVTDAARKFIKPFMAEATAIFPFFSGANGLWLWDDPTLFNNNENFAAYEHFIHGLYRLSRYKDMFTGVYQLVIPQPAHSYVDNRKPIWRGVAKGTDFLVAAHNPYAKDENEVVVVEATYNNWKVNVLLKGYEVFLCKFDMTLLGNEPSQSLVSFKIYPNPSQHDLTVGINSLIQQKANIEIVDMTGKIVYQEEANLQQGENTKSIKISQLSGGTYIIKTLNASKKFIKE